MLFSLAIFLLPFLFSQYSHCTIALDLSRNVLNLTVLSTSRSLHNNTLLPTRRTTSSHQLFRHYNNHSSDVVNLSILPLTTPDIKYHNIEMAFLTAALNVGARYGQYKRHTDNVLDWIKRQNPGAKIDGLNYYRTLACQIKGDVPEKIIEELEAALDLRVMTEQEHFERGEADPSHTHFNNLLDDILQIFGPGGGGFFVNCLLVGA